MTATDTGSARAAGRLEVGAVLGEFRLRRHLGQGPAGDLFAAEHTTEGTRVLVRVLGEQVTARPEMRARVGGDLGRLQAIEHPNVARLLELGEEGGHIFYGLADPGDLSLGDLVRKGRPLDERELVWLAAGVSSGLAALHAAEVKHGSLAPHSVFVTPRGPVIVDLAWTCRLLDPFMTVAQGQDAPPSVPHDLRAFGLLLILAASGASARTSMPDGSSPRIAALVDLLLGPVDKRPPAEKVARLFAQMAKVAGVDEGPPASIVALIEQARAGAVVQETRPTLDLSGAPALGKFGRYVLQEEIGRGGMGVVYKARHADFERYFALKVMLAGALADDTARKRFLHEAEAAAALDHPAIVRVHDCGVVDGRAYIAMDLTVGRPLTEVYKDSQWSTEALLTLFVEVLRGVHYAHSRGIVHRDLKPDNVLVDDEGKPHILDFGVAKRVGDAGGLLTVQGELVGTPAYMPPEQAEGHSNDIDTRSDVYALGASLFEVVTRGRRPFEGATVTDVLTRLLLEEPPAPSQLAPALPWEVDAIVLKAIEKQRERRYQSAAEMADDLQRFLSAVPIHARQATWSYNLKKWLARRWPVVVAAGAALSLGIGATAVVHAKTRAEVEALVAEGDRLLERQDVQGALVKYSQALLLDDAHLGASVRKERAQGLVADVEQEKKRQQEERLRAEQRQEHLRRAQELVARAKAAEQASDLNEARKAYEQATAFKEVAPPEAYQGLRRVDGLLALRELQERAQEMQSRDLGRAAQYERKAEAHLAKNELEAAQEAFLQAKGFGSTTAAAGLAKVNAALGARFEAEKRAEQVAQARLKVQEGRAALENNEPGPARTAFAQALGFDGTNQDALLGLEEVRRLEADIAAREDRQRLMDRAATQVDLGKEQVARGRQLFRDGEDVDAVFEAYVRAFDCFDKALFIVKDHAEARAEKTRACREASAILRDEGRYDLADFLLRGIEGGTVEAQELPADPHLVVIEADKVNVRRVLGTVVRFQATRVFDALREHVKGRAGGRYRVIIQVRCEPGTANNTPIVIAKGLWVRVEDKVAATMSRTERVDFQGGPHQRLVTVDARGRIVAPWEKTREAGFPAQRYIAEVEAVAKRLLGEMEAARGGGQ